MALHHRRTQGDVFGHVRSCLLILRERQYSGHRGPSHLPFASFSAAGRLFGSTLDSRHADERRYSSVWAASAVRTTLVLLTEDADPAAGC